MSTIPRHLFSEKALEAYLDILVAVNAQKDQKKIKKRKKVLSGTSANDNIRYFSFSMMAIVFNNVVEVVPSLRGTEPPSCLQREEHYKEYLGTS